jgi:hypothetical protein
MTHTTTLKVSKPNNMRTLLKNRTWQATENDFITGKDGCKIKVGDLVICTNNPFCKPSEVIDFFQDTIICSDGRGEAIYFRHATSLEDHN